MTLYVQVLHDGVSAGPEYLIAPLYSGQSDEELLDIKERSAREKGWTVERSGSKMHYWKEYLANQDVDSEPNRVDRYFEIRGD